jgi:hypothetical protein
MNKVLSVALFGENHDRYAVYLPAFVLGALNVFSDDDGWRVRVHVDEHVFDSRWGRFLVALVGTGLMDVVRMPEAPLTKAMMWRLDPIWDTAATFVFCRDLDAAVMPRDLACCEEFVRVAPERKLAVHTIHDSSMHEGIMGGLCGFQAPLLREATGWKSLSDLYAAAATDDDVYAQHGVDQIVLNRLLLRAGGPRLFEHRYNGWHAGPGKHPARRPGIYACGGVSSPVPDSAFGASRMNPWRHEYADRLGNHLGCAGYNFVEAERFWFTYGDPDISVAVSKVMGKSMVDQ